MPHLLSIFLCLAQPAAAGSPVSFEQGKDHLVIQIDGKPFATYVWNDPSIKRQGMPRRSPRINQDQITASGRRVRRSD